MVNGNDLIIHQENCENCLKIEEFKDFLEREYYNFEIIIQKLNDIQESCFSEENIR